jgi:hypothetical protein
MSHAVTKQNAHVLIAAAAEPESPAAVTKQNAHVLIAAAAEPESPAAVTSHGIHVLIVGLDVKPVCWAYIL